MASELREILDGWKVAEGGGYRLIAHHPDCGEVAGDSRSKKDATWSLIATLRKLLALAAQAARMSRNDAFNLADTVAEHYACGRPEEARQAIMAMAAQPATVPEGEVVVTRAEDGEIVMVSRQDEESRILSVIATTTHAGGKASPAMPNWTSWPMRKAMRDKYPDIAGDILDDILATALAAAPSPATVKESLTAEKPEAQAGADERLAAEHAYTIDAFDYACNPVGSRDWTLYWKGWQAAGAPPKPAEGGAVVALTGKYGAVLRPFVAMMDAELHANAGKGDRPGWLAMSADTCLLEIYYHVAKLQKAVRKDQGNAICEHAADVANMAMMLVDICGGLNDEH